MSRRSSVSVYDYPEHLNPFREDHQPEYEPEPFKFHTVGRPKKRRSSISNAWNLFASRKTKPVEASLNLSPRLPRTTSLANDGLREPVPPARRKLFADLSWLPGRRRFDSSSQQSSPVALRRNYEDDSTPRYRSISISRTSETPVYQPGETPMFTLRTHRYRSPSLNPSQDLQSIMNGGDYYFPPERSNRSPSERFDNNETPPRARSSSVSPNTNGGPYNARLYIDEPSPQSFQKLYINEPEDRYGATLNLNRTGELDSKNTERLYIEESLGYKSNTQSPQSNGEEQSPAVTTSYERPSPYDEPLVPQRPPRPPRTKKRRAPLPPLPRFAQKPERSASPTELPTKESPHQPSPSEEKSSVAENWTNDSEKHPMVVTGQQIEDTEQQPDVADKLTNICELQANIAEHQTNTSEQQSQILEQQTNTSEQQTSVVELQMNISELQLNATEQQLHVSEQNKPGEEEVKVITEHSTDEIHETNLNDSEQKDIISHQIIDAELEKPQTKTRTKFGADVHL